MPFSGLSLPKDDLNLIMKMEDSVRLHIPKVYSGTKNYLCYKYRTESCEHLGFKSGNL